jgi:hypothetical protein
VAEQTIDLSAQVVDIRVMRNDSWSLKITLAAPGGAPLDLTGKTIDAQLRDKEDSTDSTPLTVSPVDLSAGQFAVSQAAATRGGVYDVQVTTGSEPRTYIRGRLLLTKDVTRP